MSKAGKFRHDVIDDLFEQLLEVWEISNQIFRFLANLIWNIWKILRVVWLKPLIVATKDEDQKD